MTTKELALKIQDTLSGKYTSTKDPLEIVERLLADEMNGWIKTSMKATAEVEGVRAVLRLKNIELAQSRQDRAHAELNYWTRKKDSATFDRRFAEVVSSGEFEERDQSAVHFLLTGRHDYWKEFVAARDGE